MSANNQNISASTQKLVKEMLILMNNINLHYLRNIIMIIIYKNSYFDKVLIQRQLLYCLFQGTVQALSQTETIAVHQSELSYNNLLLEKVTLQFLCWLQDYTSRFKAFMAILGCQTTTCFLVFDVIIYSKLVICLSQWDLCGLLISRSHRYLLLCAQYIYKASLS